VCARATPAGRQNNSASPVATIRSDAVRLIKCLAPFSVTETNHYDSASRAHSRFSEPPGLARRGGGDRRAGQFGNARTHFIGVGRRRRQTEILLIRGCRFGGLLVALLSDVP